MNIVVIGKSGQLAFELSREFENSSHQVTFLGRDDIDITNSDIIGASLAPLSPDVLINASAYTAVDKAEEDADVCNAINAVAVKNLGTTANPCWCTSVIVDINGSMSRFFINVVNARPPCDLVCGERPVGSMPSDASSSSSIRC